MSAVRLEAKIHIVTGAVTSAHNIVKCANRSGLDVCDIVLESLASGEAVLSNEEKELGSGLLDLGGGTSDLAIFSGKNIKHTFVLGLGGNNLTNDIAIGVRAPLVEAEKIKTKYGTCLSQSITSEETIEIPGMGGREPRKLPRQILGEILEPRMEEIFSLIQRWYEHCNRFQGVLLWVKMKTAGLSHFCGVKKLSCYPGIFSSARSCIGRIVHPMSLTF